LPVPLATFAGAATVQFTYQYSHVGQLTATSVSDQLYVYDVPTAKMGTETYAVNALNQYTSVQ